MKTAAVAIDPWKLPIFKKHLDAAGFKYDEAVQFSHDILILQVKYEWVRDLKPVMDAAEEECQKRRKE